MFLVIKCLLYNFLEIDFILIFENINAEWGSGYQILHN